MKPAVKRGPGQPPLSEGEARRVMVRIPQEWWALVMERAGGRGKVSAWVRALIEREVGR